MKPNRFQVSASYDKVLTDKTRVFVQFFKEKDYIQINLSSALKDASAGNLTLKDSNLKEAYTFVQESLTAFKQLIIVNDAFLAAQPTPIKESKEGK